jgi:hypothetical protein
MIDAICRIGFLEETLSGLLHVAQARVQDLERSAMPVAMGCQINGCHPAQA